MTVSRNMCDASELPNPVVLSAHARQASLHPELLPKITTRLRRVWILEHRPCRPMPACPYAVMYSQKGPVMKVLAKPMPGREE